MKRFDETPNVPYVRSTFKSVDLHNLRRICIGDRAPKRHAAALMKCIGDDVSNGGTPVVGYRCPICGYSEFYFWDSKLQKAKMLYFVKPQAVAGKTDTVFESFRSWLSPRWQFR